MRADLLSGAQHRVKLAPHIPHARDAVNKKQWQYQVRAIRGCLVEVHVRVHVPETGDEILAPAVDDDPALRMTRC